MSPENINKGLIPGVMNMFLEFQLLPAGLHALIDSVGATQPAPQVSSDLIQGSLKQTVGVWEFKAVLTDDPNLRVGGRNAVPEHETAEGM